MKRGKKGFGALVIYSVLLTAFLIFILSLLVLVASDTAVLS